eukprot:jgi/Chrpa1/3596/Chrysochromulina_OHIO_Genome00002461-RA
MYSSLILTLCMGTPTPPKAVDWMGFTSVVQNFGAHSPPSQIWQPHSAYRILETTSFFCGKDSRWEQQQPDQT